ncbi:MAG: thioredoxin domain-containing protein [Sphingopyxis sp.]|uniref:thioredoxin family protein n=1 Tax=Sphingopyxis sp. TaxID=1908224 RepID=UPI002ABC50BF|nr:thioredoxin domain-containing protein [Sphingopyxis sp.]MDZ3832846.1 thioredoxin domain-containing protein [Sphingopyxis sp.]
MNIHDADFEERVLKAAGPVLVDIWAHGCGPCKMVGAGLERIHARDPEAFSLLFANQEDIPEAAARLGVRASPTLVLFHQGQEIARRSGALIESQLVNWLNQSLPAT